MCKHESTGFDISLSEDVREAHLRSRSSCRVKDEDTVTDQNRTQLVGAIAECKSGLAPDLGSKPGTCGITERRATRAFHFQNQTLRCAV
jgi:hypothetical protein